LYARQHEVEQEKDVQDAIAKLEQRALSGIQYAKAERQLQPSAAKTVETSFLVVPQLARNNLAPTVGARVVLALARGVLYALDRSTGDLRWAMRVGIDTTTLPVALPATQFSPELFLVLSADRNTLMAVNAHDGTPLWQHQLKGACLGRPV